MRINKDSFGNNFLVFDPKIKDLSKLFQFIWKFSSNYPYQISVNANPKTLYYSSHNNEILFDKRCYLVKAPNIDKFLALNYEAFKALKHTQKNATK